MSLIEPAAPIKDPHLQLTHCIHFKIKYYSAKASENSIVGARHEDAAAMAIRTKNLNLIPVLQALLKHESVARAADEVGLSQPAMSGSLARLRELLNDELLVRVGRSMRLTPRAMNLRKQLDEVCAQIELLFQPVDFDPSVAKCAFHIAAPDYIAFLLTDTLTSRLACEAPGIEIHFVDVPPSDIVTELETARINLMVCANFGHWPELQNEFLFREHYVIAAAEGHPLLESADITIASLQNYPSPGVSYSSAFPNPESRRWQTGIAAIDLVSQISSMNQFNALLLAANSDIIARTPATLAWRLRDLVPLKVIELKNENTAFETCMFWTATTDRAQEHIWLRSIIREALTPYNDIGSLVGDTARLYAAS